MREFGKKIVDFSHKAWSVLEPIFELIKSPLGMLVIFVLCVMSAYFLATCGIGCGIVNGENGALLAGTASISDATPEENKIYSVATEQGRFSLLSYDWNHKDLPTLLKLCSHIKLRVQSDGYEAFTHTYPSIFSIRELPIALKKSVVVKPPIADDSRVELVSLGAGRVDSPERQLIERMGETDNLLKKKYDSAEVWEIGPDVLFDPSGKRLPGRKVKAEGEALLESIVRRNIPEILDRDHIKRGILERYFKNRGDEWNMLALYSLFDQLSEESKHSLSLFVFNKLAALEAAHRCEGASANSLEEYSVSREFRYRASKFFRGELEAQRWLNRKDVLPAIALGADFCDVLTSARATPSNDFMIPRTELMRERDAKREVLSALRQYIQFLRDAVEYKLVNRDSRVFYYAEECVRKCFNSESGRKWNLMKELNNAWEPFRVRSRRHPAYKKPSLSECGYSYPWVCQN